MADMTDIVERLRRVAGLGLINSGLMDDAAKEIERLREALRNVVDSVHDYERVNKLAPNPGRTECWKC
jgi:hypothetical protein